MNPYRSISNNFWPLKKIVERQFQERILLSLIQKEEDQLFQSYLSLHPLKTWLLPKEILSRNLYLMKQKNKMIHISALQSKEITCKIIVIFIRLVEERKVNQIIKDKLDIVDKSVKANKIQILLNKIKQPPLRNIQFKIII